VENGKADKAMNKITPFLWFNNNAEEATRFYISIFKNAKILDTQRYGEEGPGPKGGVMYTNFRLDGQEFMALNGGPELTFSSATSFFINCDTQKEVDYFWDKLAEGGQNQQCGWVTDKFGVTWQVVPAGINELLHGPDPVRSKRVFEAMLKMKKLDINELRRVYEMKEVAEVRG
jgi:predicted 3-demethylubiquinone-9 3-methyltransferase (glyoxalase superfamily)